MGEQEWSTYLERDDIRFRPTREWVELNGSVERAYEQAMERLKLSFDMEAFLHFIELAFDLHRVDQVDHWLTGDKAKVAKTDLWTAYCQLWEDLDDNHADVVRSKFSRDALQYLGIQAFFVHGDYERCLAAVDKWAFNQDELDAGLEFRVQDHKEIWVHRMRAKVYEKLDRDQEAKKEWEGVLEQNPGNPNLFAEALSILMIPPFKPYRIAFRSHSRFYQKQFHDTMQDLPDKTREDLGAMGLGLKSVYRDPLVIDAALAFESEDRLEALAGANRPWVEFFSDWHHGDYASCNELLLQINEAWQPENALQYYGLFIALWRLMWVQGEYGLLHDSIHENQNKFSAEILPIEMVALKSYALAKGFGLQAAKAGMEVLRTMDLLYYSSRYGEMGFDAFLYAELAVMAGEESFLRRLMDRMLKDEPMRDWVVGRYSESWGRLRHAKEAYETLLEGLDDRHPGYFVRGEAFYRLALLSLDLGLVEMGRGYEEAFGQFCEKYHPGHEVYAGYRKRIEAKRLYVTGRYLKALDRYQNFLAESRRQGRVETHSYQVWCRDYIAILLGLGHLSAAKAEIDQLPEKDEVQRLYRAKYVYEWAKMAGEPDHLKESFDLIQKGLADAKIATSLIRELNLLVFCHEEEAGLLQESSLQDLANYDVDVRESPLDFEIAFALIRGRRVLGIEQDLEYGSELEDQLNAAGRPPLLQAQWLRLQAHGAENAGEILASRYELLKTSLGLGNLTTMHALLDLGVAMDDEDLMNMMETAKTALMERVGSLPTERQLIYARDLMAVYERTAKHVLRLDDPTMTEAFYQWTQMMKGLPLRIQHKMALRMRDKGRIRDFDHFSILSQQIFDPRSDVSPEDRQAWIKERQELMESLEIYEDRIFKAVEKEDGFVPPQGWMVIELVETMNSVYRWKNDGAGLTLEDLGSRQDWEKRIRLFRRKLLRNQADYKSMAQALFAYVNPGDQVILLPDGIFYSLPFWELAQALGLGAFEARTILKKDAEQGFKARWDKGLAFLASQYEEKPDLPAIAQEAEDLWVMGLLTFEVPAYMRSMGDEDHRGFFHFSGHGEYLAPDLKGVLRNPFVESCLVLPSGDGITALDLSVMDWSECPLVVLNACESGSGAYVPMQGVLGLGYGLFLGGAESVILTLYPVSDQAAALFSSCFYQALMKSGSRYGAMLASKDQMRQGGIAEKEIAAFQLLGSGGVCKEAWLSRLVRWFRRQRRKKAQ
jgi:hypothetical protein